MRKNSGRRGGASGWSETGAITASNRLDDWISIQPDGMIVVNSGKVELGTGVRTALAQIVAEELEVPAERVRMVMGDTRRTPDEGYTAGSKTIQFGGFGLRQVGAHARAALIERAAEHFGVEPGRLSVGNGTVYVPGAGGKSVTYAELAGGRPFDRIISGEMRAKDPGSYRVVGSPQRRVELPAKFTGAQSFVHDMKLPGMLHARVVRPPSPGARIKTVRDNPTGTEPRPSRLIRIGESFLAVVAEREEDAVRAARSVEVTWSKADTLPPMDGIYDEIPTMPSLDRSRLDRGDARRAIDAAENEGRKVVRAEYRQPYQAHASLGPSCAVADYVAAGAPSAGAPSFATPASGATRAGAPSAGISAASAGADRVNIWCSSQGVYPLRDAIAELLSLEPEQVNVVHVEGAGCYGHNGADDVAADAALVSREAGAPVRLQWSREDEFGWEPYGPAMVIRMEGALDRDHRMDALRHEAWTPSHAYRPRTANDLLAQRLVTGEPIAPRTMYVGGDRNAPTDYRIPNEEVVMHWLERSPFRVSALRSLGGTANAYANECFVDELAHAADADPVRFRLDHLDDPRAIEVVRRAAGAAGWSLENGWPATDGRGEGYGIAFARYENAEAYVASVAHVAVNGDTGEVRALRFFVAHDCGLIINPDGLRNQIEGNLIQGTSRALLEEVTWDLGGVTSLDWNSYPILPFRAIPDIVIVLIDRPEERAVGAGEPATITAAPAIANAVFNAIGIRLREVPFTPKRVAALL